MRRARQEKIDLTDPVLVRANQEETILPIQLTMLTEELSVLKYPPLGTILFLGGGALLLLISVCSIVPQLITHSFSGFDWVFVLVFAVTVVGGIWELIALLARRRYQQQLLAAGPYLVKRTQGEVIWDGVRYSPHVPGMRVLRASMTIPLLPGPYDFFYEPESKLVLSAQPIRTTASMLCLPDTFSATGLPPDEQARQAIQSALYQVLDFTILDLQANRQGQLSTKQQPPPWFPRRPDQEVQSVEGEVEAQIQASSSDDDEYYYVIDELELELPRSNVTVKNALVSGLRYRVYYMDRGHSHHQLLSIEPLQAPSR